MPLEFATRTRSENGVLIVEVAGEIDLFTAPELKSAITTGLDAGTDKIMIDLTETTFLDSTALGVLIGALKRLRDNDGAMTIVNSDANIAKTFEITGLDQILKIYTTPAEAIAAL